MSLEDDEPMILPDDPKYHVFDENALSILGRLLNPEAQNMARMIDYMPQAWRLYDRVRGISLTRDRFQFVFKREEDLVTVLNDRPWSYNHWTMVMERWTPSPPRDFLSTFEEIAYDPKSSQKTEYIRAKVLFTATNPAFEAKNLTLPSEEIVVIEYEYEKIHKRCFSCHRLTHEKSACPYVKSRTQKSNQKTEERNIRAVVTPPNEAPRLEGPPGFPLLFPELQGEERAMAIQYISHADETERRARILRVQQSIEEDKNKTPTVLAKISHDVNKEKGHVFSYDMPHSEGFPLVGKSSRHAKSARSGDLERASQAGSSSGESNNVQSVPMGPTVFSAGALGSTSIGILRNKKKARQRPPAWVRHVRPNRNVTHKDQVEFDKLEGDSGPAKRKAEETELTHGNKSTKTKEESDLRLLSPQ
ncbi:PREDICTED: uncharacterized protein At4g02000-like [Brassica oleracea var. oleracea]|uniref:uncharacterized protein At4g02000-like n=1 Tax=Brassica oleracea var. oleracea TaxID=109376 RepID=UPI0006A6A67E|nr:PREDICTED: uncharacterized protein At4g02000-like [Brassica oleracea var. oleracea]